MVARLSGRARPEAHRRPKTRASSGESDDALHPRYHLEPGRDPGRRPGRRADHPLLHPRPRPLRELEHEVVADEPGLRATRFGERPAAEALIAEISGAPVGFALFFTNYSTFLGKSGLHLEDLFVEPDARGRSGSWARP